MVENFVITKTGNEAEDASKTVFSSSREWETGGANLVVYKNGQLLIREDDYTLLDSTHIKLSDSAINSDQVTIMISNLGSTQSFQLDRANKKLQDKNQSSVDKAPYEEAIPSTLIVHSDEVWASPISSDPNDAIASGSAQLFPSLELTEDLTVSGKKGWYASSNGRLSGRLDGWIPPRFGQSYTIRLYDVTGSEIPSSDSMNWVWDYHSGYLTIEKDHTHRTPFRIKGYRYIGAKGTNVDTSSRWKAPVPTESALPSIGNQDGDIRVVLADNGMWRWDSDQEDWIRATTSNYKSPVQDFSDLPVENNSETDIRLVIDNNTLYRWDTNLSQWLPLIFDHDHNDSYYLKTEIDTILDGYSDQWHVHDARYYTKPEVDDIVRWRPSVETEADLPPHTENRDGDCILTRDQNIIWRWVEEDPNTGQGYWLNILGFSLFWRDPVPTHIDLPMADNVVGHVRLVLDEGKAYWWDGTQWLALTGGDHNHDDLYYRKPEIDAIVRWKSPVANYSSLPLINNDDGDVRLTVDTNNIYRWDTGTMTWDLISASPRWREPVDLLTNLPTSGNVDGDIRVSRDTMLIYQWNEADSQWENVGIGPHDHDDRYYTETELDAGQLDNRYYTESEIDSRFDTLTGHDHDGINSKQIDYNNILNTPYFYWRDPVQTLSDLPVANQSEGDAHVVLDEQAIYAWIENEWIRVSSGTLIDHNHDERYYREDEVDDILNNLQLWVTNQLALKSDIGHDHDDIYYRKNEVEDFFDIHTGHDHDGINSKQISYYDLVDVPPLNAHNHDDRYYTKTEMQTPGESLVHWDNIINTPLFPVGQWKRPVQTVADLPASGNDTGDLRVVLDDSDIYEWDGSQWIYVGHWAFETDYWKSPVNEYNDLPLIDNVNGDVRLVLEENSLYRWNESLQMWVILSTGNLKFQVYLNGLQLLEGEEWVRIKETGVRLLVDVDAGDLVGLVIWGDYFLRQDFVAYDNQTDFEIRNEYSREEHIIQTTGQTAIVTNTIYHPGQADLIVWLNGLLQKNGEDYVEDHPTQFTFTEPLRAGDRVIIIIMGVASGQGSFIREDQVPIQNGQHHFTLQNAYAMGTGSLLVYLNGQLRRQNEDYFETSTTGIETVLGLNTDDMLTFIIFGAGVSGSECCNAQNVVLGTPTDSSWLDGLISWWNPQYKVNDAIDDINEVLLQVAPAPPTNFNSKDLVPENLTLVSGYESEGNAHHEGAPGDYHTYLTENDEFRLFTPNGDSFADADKGELVLYLNNVQIDSFNLYDAFVEADMHGTQTAINYGVSANGARDDEGYIGTEGAIRNSTGGFISIMEITRYNEFSLWQRGRVRININPGDLRQGFNEIYLVHNLSTGTTHRSNTLKLFLDTANNRPELDPFVALENTALNSTKYLSGVRYFSIGDEFRLIYYGHKMFNNTYKQEPVHIDMPGLSPTDISWDHSDVSGVNDPPQIGDVMDFNGLLTLDEMNEYSINARMRIETYDPFGPGEDKLTTSVNRLVNTYMNGSTDLKEYFRDEKYRLPDISEYDVPLTSRTGNWNSENPLTVNDALLFDEKLMFANIDFTSGYRPAQTVNYSSYNSEQAYIRTFYHPEPHNSGTFKIVGLTELDLRSNRLWIEIKLPSQTGWLRLNNDYDVVDFTGSDFDGCLLNVDGDEFTYTSGTFSTANSGYQVVLRIRLPGPNVPHISYIELMW